MSFYKIKTNKGFTLIELLVVISIISILSTIVVASLNSARDKARLSGTVSELLQIQKAIQLYALDHNGNVPLNDTWWYSDVGYGSMGTQYMSYGPYLGNTSDPFFSDFVKTLVPNYLGSVPNFNISSFLKSNQPKNTVALTYYVFKDSKTGAFVMLSESGEQPYSEDAVYCGGIKKERYIIVIMTDQPSYLNIPEFSGVFRGNNYNNPISSGYSYYCIGE